MDGNDPLVALDNVRLLRGLSPELRARLSGHLGRHHLAQGALLYSQGDPGDALFVVETGEVSLHRGDSELGVAIELALLGPGEAFGEMSVVTGDARTSSATAMLDTELWVLSRDIFQKLVAAVPQVGVLVAAELARMLAEAQRGDGVRFSSLRGRSFNPALLELVPLPLIRRHRVLPLELLDNILTVATADPQDRIALEEVRRVARGLRLHVTAVSEADFRTFYNQQVAPHETRQRDRSETLRQRVNEKAKRLSFHNDLVASERAVDQRTLLQAASGADVVALINHIVTEGIERDCSDILIEPDRAGAKVRYRVDGRLLYREGALSSGMHAAILSRLKVLANLDITERRMPQDGRVSCEVGARSYDLRLATVNTKYGEKMTLRLLDSTGLQADLSGLILDDGVLNSMRRLIHRSMGLVLVTGPTGSGKTTTLYAALQERNKPDVSVCAIEDPIEYELGGISQVEVHEAMGFTFGTAMRAFMRQAPDIIMVGETRDSDVAQLACNAALTGHLVLTSFHTNDALAAVHRLLDMRVEPYVLSAALAGVVNQRLVRRVCPGCRVVVRESALLVSNLQSAGVPVPDGLTIYTGKGCSNCGGEGFKGRIGLYEVLTATPGVRDAISEGRTPSALREAALERGYVPMAHYAAFLLEQGLTVPSEVLRVLPVIEG
jgi:type IV pilus assembly protein PilB